MMKLFETSQDLAEFVGGEWRSLQNKTARDRPFIVSSPLSSTPRPLYQWVVGNAGTFTNWSQFRFLMMDEQFATGPNQRYIEANAPTSFVQFAHTHLIDPLSRQVHVDSKPVVILPELDKLPQTDAFLREHGGIDLLILAVGLDGHYAQVMPGTPFQTGYHIARLTNAVTAGHTQTPTSPFFGHALSDYGMSLGPMQVAEAKVIYVLITGQQKQSVAKRLLHSSTFDPEFPISVVCHPQVRERVTICLTTDAYDSTKTA